MDKNKDTLIYGAGGLGREIRALIERDYTDELRVVGFIDDGMVDGDIVDGLPIFSRDVIHSYDEVAVVIGIADTKVKSKLFEELSAEKNVLLPSIVSKNAVVYQSAHIGKGVVIQDLCFVSINTIIDDGVLLNVGTTVGHDSVIGKCSSVMTQTTISGHIKIGERSFLGGHSFVVQGLTIGNNAVIAAGTVLFKNMNDRETAFGNPAKILRATNDK